jgi:hypothetical protein
MRFFEGLAAERVERCSVVHDLEGLRIGHESEVVNLLLVVFEGLGGEEFDYKGDVLVFESVDVMSG